MNEVILRDDEAIARLASEVERVAFLTHDSDGRVEGHVALVAGYDAVRGIRLVVAARPGSVIADTDAVVVGDAGGAIFYATGRAVGRHDAGVLQQEWRDAWDAAHPARWNDPALLAVSLMPSRAEAWRPEASGGLAWTRAALDALRRHEPIIAHTMGQHVVLAERRVEPIDAVTRASMDSFPASDPPSFNPGHA